MLDLDWILSPFDKTRFIDEVWQTEPRLIATDRPGFFAGLFNKQALERILEYSQPQPPSIRLASATRKQEVNVPFSPNGRINIDQVRKLYIQGHTLILNSVEDFDPAVSELARAIETEMGARVLVNSYLTPPSAQGFDAHYDTHDVLVAQVQGEKLWKVYGADSVCPLNEMHDSDPRVPKTTQPPDEIRLRPGDLLYIPRGWFHEAATDGAASLHLTFGIYPAVGKDLLHAALEVLIGQHPELREALPVGPLSRPERRASLQTRFARLVELFVAHASAIQAAQAIDEGLLRRGRSGGDGHLFGDVEQLPALTGDTLLERRTNLPCRVVKTEGGVGLQFLNGLVKGPPELAPAMAFVAARVEPFTPSHLPELNPDLQLLFASTLVSDGLCRIAQANPCAESIEADLAEVRSAAPQRPGERLSIIRMSESAY